MKSFTNSFIILFLLTIADSALDAQAVYATFANGKWEYVSSSSPSTDGSGNHGISGYSSASLLAGSRFKLLFSKDSADAFTPGFYAYSTASAFAAMDIGGSGKKAIVMSILDSASGRVTTNYYSPATFQPIFTVVDTGYKHLVLGTQTANLPITSTASLQHFVYYGSVSGSSVPPLGTVNTQVRSGFSGQTLFRAVVGDNIKSYYYARGFLDESKTNFDLTGNGLYEIIGLGRYSDSLGGGFRLYVYDNLAIIDSISDARWGLFGGIFTTANDMNSDGRPEVVVSVDDAPNFHQWDPAVRKFKLLGSLSGVKTMLMNPENVDADSSKEIIVHTGSLGDSLAFYTSTFTKKTQIKVPGIGIIRYFVEKLKSTPNKQIIAVGALLWPGTYVFDLSLGQTPIWSDTTFEALAVGDLRKVGHNEILGIKLIGPFGSQRGNLTLIDPTNGFKPVWTLADSNLSYSALAGPFKPANDEILDRLVTLTYKPMPRLAAADFNGDGVNDFVMKTLNKSYMPLYLIVSANGTVLDSLPGIPATSTALAYDFNGNGRPELIMTYVPGSFLLPGDLKIRKSWVFEYDGVTAVQRSSGTPSSFTLGQNYPNPFNPSTTIRFAVSQTQFVSLRVFDLLGREVKTLVNEVTAPGDYQVRFDGSGLSSGVYFYRLEVNQYIETKKLVLLK